MAGRIDMLRFYLGRLGNAGMLGALLLLGSLVFLAAVIQPKEKALRDLALRNEQARTASAAEQARAARAQSEQALHPSLAPEAAVALRRLYDAAGQSGLELVQGEYRLVEYKDSGMRQYQFLLPVYGSYAGYPKIHGAGAEQ